MRYRCDNAKCPAKFAAAVGKPKMTEPPIFEEKRLATYEMNEDGDTLGLLSWEDTDHPVICARCRKPAKVLDSKEG